MEVQYLGHSAFKVRMDSKRTLAIDPFLTGNAMAAVGPDDMLDTNLVLVTHDRYLVDRLASQLWIIDMRDRLLDVFPGTWAEYVEARSTEEQTTQARQAKEKWSEEQRRARREEKRMRRDQEARRQRVTELEMEIHHLEGQLQALQEEIVAASETQQAMRVHELGMLYGELEGQLQQHMDLWVELAG